MCHSGHNLIQTELAGIKVLFLLPLINTKIPTDFTETKAGLRWPTTDIVRIFPNTGCFGYNTQSHMDGLLSASPNSCQKLWCWLQYDNKNYPSGDGIYYLTHRPTQSGVRKNKCIASVVLSASLHLIPMIFPQIFLLCYLPLFASPDLLFHHLSRLIYNWKDIQHF